MLTFNCDALLSISLSKENITFINEKITPKKDISNYILTILQYGLSTRVRGINKVKEISTSSRLVFGLYFDPDQIFRLVDKGPNPQEKIVEAESFRKFWGSSKCQLRKFQNSNVIECVVWDTTELKEDRHLILKSVIQHIMELHLNLSEPQLHLYGLELLPLADVLSQPLDRQDGSSLLQSAFAKLKDVLMGIETSLNIQSVVPICSSIRGTVYSDCPIFSHLNSYLQSCTSSMMVAQAPISVHSLLIILESSCRWPNEQKAFMALATAFLGNVGLGIIKSCPHSSVSISTNNEGPSFMDVFIDGFIFRCHLDLSFAFSQLVDKLSWNVSSKSSITLLPKDNAPLNNKIIVSLWRENHDYFHPSGNTWIEKCNLFSFNSFSEALSHDVFIKNSIYSVYPKPILDGIKLLTLWISNKKLGNFISIEDIEKIVVEANHPSPNSDIEDISSSQLKMLSQESIYKPFDPPTEFIPDKDSSATSSSTMAFINSLELFVNGNDQFFATIGISELNLLQLSKIASESLTILSILLENVFSLKYTQSFKPILLELFRVNNSFDFTIEFDSGRFLSDIRIAVIEEMNQKNNSESSPEDVLSKLVMPGFNPLSLFNLAIKSEFGDLPILVYSPLSIDVYDFMDKKEANFVSHTIGITATGPLEKASLHHEMLDKLKSLFGNAYVK